MIFFIIMFLCLLLLYMIVLSFIFWLRIKTQNQITKQKNAVCISKQIMDNVKTNRTYPELHDIFSQQKDKGSIKQNVNFEGYFKIKQD